MSCKECEFLVMRGYSGNDCGGSFVDTVYSCSHPENELCGYKIDVFGRREISRVEAYGCVRFECPKTKPNRVSKKSDADYGEI